MSGVADRVVADTSVMSAFFAGDEAAGRALLGRSTCISFITEMELMANPAVNGPLLAAMKDRLEQTPIAPITPTIKTLTIELRRGRLLKLPDAMIAATAMALHVPLVTADKRFMKVADRLDVRLVKLAR